MPDWPEEARARALAALDNRAYEDGLDITDQQARQLVTDILDAAAPLLAGAVAAKILEHAERQHPRDPDHVPTAWHRHFSTAARVAAGAFDTREDQLRMAAEAIGRGDFIACNPPEVPVTTEPSREQRENEWFLSRFDEITDAVAPRCTDPAVNEAYRLLFAQRDRIRHLGQAAVTEHAQLMSGGGYHVWNTEPYILEIYPLEQKIEHGQRFGGKVYRRRVIVVEDWEEVPGGA